MPILKVIAGPNGSGKSTLIALLTNQGIAWGEYLNADDIARNLTGAPEDVAARAQQIVRDRRQEALANKRDHAFETVMSHHSHIEYMIQARQAGFEVRLYFVATADPVINVDRVANRVRHGGHAVPADRVIARYQRCLDNLPDAIRAADFCRIFDNSSTDRVLRELAVIGRTQSSNQHFIRHNADPDDIPVWWLEILLSLRPIDTFTNGLIA